MYISYTPSFDSRKKVGQLQPFQDFHKKIQEISEMPRQEEPVPVPSYTEEANSNFLISPVYVWVHHCFLHTFFCDLFLFQKLRFFDDWSLEIFWRNSLVCSNRQGLLSNRRDWWRRGLEKWHQLGVQSKWNDQWNRFVDYIRSVGRKSDTQKIIALRWSTCSRHTPHVTLELWCKVYVYIYIRTYNSVNPYGWFKCHVKLNHNWRPGFSASFSRFLGQIRCVPCYVDLKILSYCRTSAGTSVATLMPFSASKSHHNGEGMKDLLQDLPSSSVSIQHDCIMSSLHLRSAGNLPKWHAFFASGHPRESRTCAAATIFLELESPRSQMAIFGDLWLWKVVEGIAASVHNAKFVATQASIADLSIYKYTYIYIIIYIYIYY